MFASLNCNDSSDSDTQNNIKRNVRENKSIENSTRNIENNSTVYNKSNISTEYDFGNVDNVFTSSVKIPNKTHSDNNFNKNTKKNIIKDDFDIGVNQNNNDNPFNTHYSKKTIKKNIKINKIKNVLEDVSFRNIPENGDINDLEMQNYFKPYAHLNKDKNWDYPNYFKMTDNGLRSWKEIATFLNTLNATVSSYTMNDFDIFIMKNNISPKWEDELNKYGSIMSIKVSCNENAYSIFKFLFLNFCNNSLLKYTDKTLGKTNGMSFSTRTIENINVTSYIVKVWFRENFCRDETAIFNPHIIERLERDNFSLKFKQIKPEF